MITFVDTNVLVYGRDTTESAKHRRAHAWLEHLWTTRTGRLSAQVLNEYYVTVTRKLDPGLPTAEAHADVADLGAWSPVGIDTELVLAAFAIEDDHAISYWDALIVAAAHRSGSTRLLTEDLADGRSIGAVTVTNPFTHAPER